MRNGMAQSLIDASSMVRASLFSEMPFIPDAVQRADHRARAGAGHQVDRMLRASSALITPMCAKPRAAPPPSASPTRNWRGGSALGGGAFVAAPEEPLLPTMLLPVVEQAASAADAAATKNARREKRGDDDFKGFLQRRAVGESKRFSAYSRPMRVDRRDRPRRACILKIARTS